MASLNIGRLLVVEEGNSKKLIGIITRSDLLKPRLKHHTSENVRERVLRTKKLS